MPSEVKIPERPEWTVLVEPATEFREVIAIPLPGTAWRYVLCAQHAEDMAILQHVHGGHYEWFIFRSDGSFCQVCYSHEHRPGKEPFVLSQTLLIRFQSSEKGLYRG